VKVAYVDSSALVAMAFDEYQGHRVREALAGYDRLFSSDLLEAELRSVFHREGRPWSDAWVAGVGRVRPEGRLGSLFDRVLSAGFLRGADLWHLACALHLAELLDPLPSPPLGILTLDGAQREAGEALGLEVGP